jgi:hypothetical protein
LVLYGIGTALLMLIAISWLCFGGLHIGHNMSSGGGSGNNSRFRMGSDRSGIGESVESDRSSRYFPTVLHSRDYCSITVCMNIELIQIAVDNRIDHQVMPWPNHSSSLVHVMMVWYHSTTLFAVASLLHGFLID